jgi:hypothetical protein
MKKIPQTLMLLLFVSSLCAQAPSNTVNPVIGDESYLAFFGVQPDQSSDEQLRVKLHLFYVEQILRERSAAVLTDQQKANREKVLDLLHDYWKKGVFPSNFDYPFERRPCFIDKNGTICAVGYLVEKTAGIELAEQINSAHQYDFLADMNEPALAAWAEENGFTLEECAMIQPSYGPALTDETIHMPITGGYGVSSGLLGGINIAVNTVNLSGRFGNTKAISYIGFFSGASQLILGLANIKKDRNDYSGWSSVSSRTISYKAQRNLSYVNIAMGTTTLVTSALNLYINGKIKNKKNTVGLYSYTCFNNDMNLGLSFARRL